MYRTIRIKYLNQPVYSTKRLTKYLWSKTPKIPFDDVKKFATILLVRFWSNFLASRPENFKKSKPKKLVKSNKWISQKIFWPKFIFCNFKNGQKSIFELGKSLKLNIFHFHFPSNWFIWFHEFFWLGLF